MSLMTTISPNFNFNAKISLKSSWERLLHCVVFVLYKLRLNTYMTGLTGADEGDGLRFTAHVLTLFFKVRSTLDVNVM